MLEAYCKHDEVETTITRNGDYGKRPSDIPAYEVECPNCGAEDELVKFDAPGSSFDLLSYSKHDLLKYKVDRIHYICENCECEFFKTYRHNNSTDEFGFGKFSWLKAEVTDDLWRIVRLACYILMGVILAVIGYANDFNGVIDAVVVLFLIPITVAFCVEFLLFFME